jgi:hypothetical protein
MKNIFVLPTDKPSRLYEFGGEYHLQIKSQENFRSQHIYITSDGKIKVGDWVYCNREGFEPVLKQKVNPMGVNNDPLMKKIILTTDQDLIKDGVQAIDDEFLEWFVKNPNCEYVGVEWKIVINYSFPRSAYFKYKIIIPKEEPKQELNFYEKLKEYFENTPREKVLEDWNKSAHLDNVGPTVDEFLENSNEERLKDVAERFYSEQSESYENAIEPTFDDSRYLVTGFIDGVKSDIAKEYWFEKFEEDLKTAYFSGIKTTGEGWNGEYANGNHPNVEETFEEKFQEWFEKYKKK